MKNFLIKQCLDILKTEDVRNEIKVLFSPVTDLILYEIYPYIYVIIFLVFLCLLQFLSSYFQFQYLLNSFEIYHILKLIFQLPFDD